MEPYYDKDGITIYCGDGREILPSVVADTMIVDPVWPNSTAAIVGIERATELFREIVEQLPACVKRVAVHLGCDSDPLFLMPLVSRFAFFRVCWLEYTRPHYVGRLMYGSDVAYLWGPAPKSRPGQHVIPGRHSDTSSTGKESKHPCPRKLAHVKWLVKWWTEDSDVIVDPCMGSGTTLLAAKQGGHRAIGIEIEERFCEMAVKRLRQRQLITADSE